VHPDGTEQRAAHELPSLRGICAKFTLMRLFGKKEGHRKLALPPPGSPPVAVDYVIGAVVLVRRSSFPGARLLDEDFFFYYEDTDLCRRIKDAGRRVLYVPAAEVLHHGGASSEKNYYRITRIYFQSLLTYVRKHHLRERSEGWWVLFKILFLGNLVYDLFKHASGFLWRPSRAARRANRIRALTDLILHDLRPALAALTSPARWPRAPGGPAGR
jgi:GT2 family glycosyltransferase